MSAITSRPYSPSAACERCVFGRGEHANWCGSPDWVWVAPGNDCANMGDFRKALSCVRCETGLGEHAIWCPRCTEVTVTQEMTSEEAQVRRETDVTWQKVVENHLREATLRTVGEMERRLRMRDLADSPSEH